MGIAIDLIGGTVEEIVVKLWNFICAEAMPAEGVTKVGLLFFLSNKKAPPKGGAL